MCARPKPRLISAAPFRDRVVHHALTRVIEPVFEARFLPNSFACRKGLGTHKALERARNGCGRWPYVLKCDVRKYFPSIDHAILKELLERTLKCPRTLERAARIIDGSNEQEEAIFYFPGDTLFTPHERRRGLPLGNQTSQFFANVYLNPLDHFVVRELRPALYLRYVDDFLLFGDDKAAMATARARIEEFLQGLRLLLHDGKSRVYRSEDGVTFLGWRVFPGRMRLVRGNVVRFRRRMRRFQHAWALGEMTLAEIRARAVAWIGHAAHGQTRRLRRQLFWQYPFSRTEQDRTVARRLLEQQSEERARLEP